MAFAKTILKSNFPVSESTGNIGNDMGMPTVGYRSAKFNPMEWQEANYARYYQSFAGRDELGQLQTDINAIVQDTRSKTDQLQAMNTKRLVDRVRDIDAWKNELHNIIKDMTGETELLFAQKNRLEAALRSLEIPHHIALDNLNCRQKRQGIDLVQDDVELALLKEIEVINGAQELLKRTIQEAEIQIKRNRDQKQTLEFDWSDKKESKELDEFCARLRNEHTSKQYYPGAARFQEIQSTPESWAQFTHDNIERAEQERLASIQLRKLIDNIIHDVSSDVKHQCDVTDDCFQRRVAQLEGAKDQLEDEIRKVCDSIDEAEKTISGLKGILKDIEDPMKVAQTRLHNREFRPRVELCRDPAQYGLIEEVKQLSTSNNELYKKLEETENYLKLLQDQRMALEKNLMIKKNSIFIDKEKCMPRRATRQPTISKLQGY